MFLQVLLLYPKGVIKIADGGKLIIKIDGDTKGFYDKTGDLDKFTNKALKNIAKGAILKVFKQYWS